MSFLCLYSFHGPCVCTRTYIWLFEKSSFLDLALRLEASEGYLIPTFFQSQPGELHVVKRSMYIHIYIYVSTLCIYVYASHGSPRTVGHLHMYSRPQTSRQLGGSKNPNPRFWTVILLLLYIYGKAYRTPSPNLLIGSSQKSAVKQSHT